MRGWGLAANPINTECEKNWAYLPLGDLEKGRKKSFAKLTSPLLTVPGEETMLKSHVQLQRQPLLPSSASCLGG